MRDLKGRVAVITGAGSGMGRSMALSLAREGVDVVVADIESEWAENVRTEIEALGREAIAVRTDVSDAASVGGLADQAFGRFGKVDILINNAGVTLVPFRAVWDTSLADFQWTINVNLFGVIHGITAFVPRMRAQAGDKHIVNTSSLAGIVNVPGNAAYVASKMAITGLSDTIREELEADDFGVTVLLPGFVHSNILSSERLRPEVDRAGNRSVPSYSDYAVKMARGDTDNSDIAGAVTLKDAGTIAQGIDPDTVGPMVVHAIRENEPYCITHPSPVDAIRKRADALTRAYFPVTEPA
jgi:NAD(P)-dependent dehydrogenase (short-subunit alcohol dehydrogenase family)